MSTYRETYHGPKELQFADPENFLNTVKVVHNVQPKRAGSLSVYNAQSQINMQRNAVVPGCEPSDPCNANTEKLSLRFSLSGSTANHAAVAKLWTDFKVAGDLMISDLSKGFLPTDVVLTFV